MIFMLNLMQTYLNQVGITPTSGKFHLSNCFVTSLQYQREFVWHQLVWHFACLHNNLNKQTLSFFMYRNVATDMSPDRKVSTPQKYWQIIQPKFGNLSGAAPFQARVDLTIMMVKASFHPSLPKFTNCTVGPWSGAIPGTEPIKESFISNKKDLAQITMAITESTQH